MLTPCAELPSGTMRRNWRLVSTCTTPLSAPKSAGVVVRRRSGVTKTSAATMTNVAPAMPINTPRQSVKLSANWMGTVDDMTPRPPAVMT